MKYKNIKQAIFLERPNRFIAYAKLGDEVVTCHVKNTGRCKELLIPGKTPVYLADHGSSARRKTRYSLVTVNKNGRIINMDSQAPNQIAYDWLCEGNLYPNISYLKREQVFSNSRFDLYYERSSERKGFIEVKGVTLEENNIAKFPDAPTQRRIKHLYELMEARRHGYEATVLFVIQMSGIEHFEPNNITHAAFGDALKKAQNAGVHILAIDCQVTPDEVCANRPIPVFL